MTMSTKTLRTHAGGADRPIGVRARGAKRPKPLSVVQIHDRIVTAISERRLLPGTQLVEEKLAAVFGVSRTKIRQAIARLAHDGIVTVIHNRGAFVSSPTVAEAREVFEARRLIESWLARQLPAKKRLKQTGEGQIHRKKNAKDYLPLVGIIAS